jgi:hypothetical protein
VSLDWALADRPHSSCGARQKWFPCPGEEAGRQLSPSVRPAPTAGDKLISRPLAPGNVGAPAGCSGCARTTRSSSRC